MDAFRAQLQRIQEQLSGLSASQKMLTASLIAIMTITIAWWGRYASTSETTAILEQPLSTVQMGQIKAALDSRNIPATIVGDKIMVPIDRKSEALVVLSLDNAMPDNASDVWDSLMKQTSPWDPKSKTDAIYNRSKEQTVSDSIRKFIPGVVSANVFINPISERRVGAPLEPSAAIQIRTRGRDVNPKKIAQGAAAVVVHSTSGLTRKNVSVLVDGVPQRVDNANDSVGAGDIDERLIHLQQHASDTIRSLIPMPGVLVAVTMDINTESREQHLEGYDKDKSFTKERRINTSSEDTQQAVEGGADPGTVANTSLDLGAPPPAAGNTSLIEKNETDLEVLPFKTTTRIQQPAGKASVLGAAVRLPRSYFVRRFKSQNPSAKDPDDAALTTLKDQELPGIREVVKTVVNIQSPQNIHVDMYYDDVAPELAVAGADAIASTGMGALVGSHAREIILGSLVLLSLFMVSSIVKKGTPAPALSAPVVPRESPRIAGHEDIAGIVGDGASTLDGMELDDDALRAQQMVEQVSTMVQENPDAAATLVKRWLNRT